MSKRFLICAIVVAAQCCPAIAGLTFTTTGTTTTIDFESTLAEVNNGQYSGVGLTAGAAATGELDSDTWRVFGLSDGNTTFGGSFTTGDHARGVNDGGIGTAGLYAFDTDNDATLGNSSSFGFQPAGSDVTPGEIQLLTSNSTGQIVTSVDIAYDILNNNDQGRANSLNFGWSTDGVSVTNIGALDFTSPEAADGLGWVSTARGTTITGLSIADGSDFYLHWFTDDVSGSGSRDEFALDNIAITFNATAVPEPGSLALMSLFGGCFVLRRRRREA